jgi:hypothetical protein
MRVWALLALSSWLASLAVAAAQRSDAFQASRDHPAIAYSKTPAEDPVSKLNQALASGKATLAFDPATGYLRSVLQALDVPIESQVLVFSQTSFQAPRIDEKNPRAIYFNDQVAVGWVRGGDVLEVAAQDARQGTIFYSLPQSSASRPSLQRNDTCLSCHLSWDTRAVPGLFVLTTHPRKSDSEYANGGVVDHRDPFMHRWGGWYVTGKQAPPRHMGNRAMLRPDAADPEHTPPAPAYESLTGRVDLRDYLSPHSDIVALMVLEHQSHLMNLMTRVGWEARFAEHGSPASPRAAALSPRVQEAVDEMVDYMLFIDEARLPNKIAGVSGFAEKFTARGPRDDKGRSLRDLDLTERLMRYPLSYLIYTPAFDALPASVKEAAYKQLWRILSGELTLPRHSHLTLQRRQTIVEILRSTKRDLPEYFGAVTH